MGNYATVAELQARFESDADVAHLTDTADTGTPDTTVLNEVIDHAEAELDSYIASKYEVPVKVGDHASLANIMRSKTLDLAVAFLYTRGNKLTDAIQAAIDRGIEWAKAVGKGEVMLPSTDTEPSTVSADPIFTSGTSDTSDTTSRRIFSRASMDNL